MRYEILTVEPMNTNCYILKSGNESIITDHGAESEIFLFNIILFFKKEQ